MATASATTSSSLCSLPALITRSSKYSNRKSAITCAARRHNDNFSGRLVDQNMIVLRKRIHEIKMEEEEENYDQPPAEWMDWEKGLYANYDSIICDAMAHLQTRLMETRPSLALGAMALIALSVPTSTAVLLYNIMEFTKAVLSAGKM